MPLQPRLALKRQVLALFRMFGLSIRSFDQTRGQQHLRLLEIFRKFQPFTMVSEELYVDNLLLASRVANVPGDIVECGVWRGGMIAGIAELLGSHRRYWLFDSFKGLPMAQEIDGVAAIEWQSNPKGEFYYDNCRAEQGFARQAMQMATSGRVEIVAGWFDDTVRSADIATIALLRLDGDWYESTKTCLEALYPKVADGGIIVIDDYYTWDGCSRAVHEYLSTHSIAHRIHQSSNGTAYIFKNPTQ